MTHDPDYLPAGRTRKEMDRKMEERQRKKKAVTVKAEKMLDAYETIKENYDQINHDDEREAIEEAMEEFEEACGYDFRSVAEEQLPTSRLTRLLEEGRIRDINVDKNVISEPVFGLGDSPPNSEKYYRDVYDVDLRIEIRQDD